MVDTLILSRAQFAVNMTFHILFPSLSIGLAWVLLFFKLRYSKSQDKKWMDLYFFWIKVFALSFAMGVVSGITMSFQFGTNWPGFMETIGNVSGPLLGYEVETAFFLEATFLGVMLFGFRKVSQWFHTFATFLVAFGTTLSGFWILALNSWMQTPSGYKMVDGVAQPVSWIHIIFNPSFPYRYAHMMLACMITVMFLVAGISAYRWLRKDRVPAVMTGLRVGIIGAAFFVPLQMVVGDMHGLNTVEHQPEKIAAIEAIWHTESSVPLVLFALPNQKTQKNDYAIKVPHLGSLLLTHTWNGKIRGISSFKGKHPPVLPVFFAFRIMVGIGVLMLIFAIWGVFSLRFKKDITPLLAKGLTAMTFAGWIATVAGWCVTEIGRQPWLVTGVLKTADAVTKIPSPYVSVTLTMYIVVYAILLSAYVSTIFYMARKAGDVEDLGPLPISSRKAIVDTI